MAPLQLIQLPNELILAIAQELASESDISCFSRTCRGLHELLDRLLYSYDVQNCNSWVLLWAARHNRVNAARKAIREDANLGTVLEPPSQDVGVEFEYDFGFGDYAADDDDGSEYEEEGESTTKRIPHYDTPLIIAATMGHTEMVTCLLEAGADPNLVEVRRDVSALARAARHGHNKTVEALLRCETIDVDLPAHDGCTALMEAARRGDVEMVRQLLAANTRTPNSLTRSGDTALTIALSCKHADVVRLLLESPKIDPNTRDKSGRTALHYAAGPRHYGRVDMARLLVESGRFDANLTDIHEDTPLTTAMKYEDNEVVAYLVTSGQVAPSIEVHGSNSVFRYACSAGMLDAAQYLLAHYDNFDVDKGAYRPLHVAAKRGFVEIAKLLVEVCHANVNPRGAGAKATPLLLAATRGHAAIVDVLLGSGRVEDVDVENFAGVSPLLAAATGGYAEICKQLIRQGADVKAGESTGRSALAHVCRKGLSEVALMLLERGADPSARTNGMSALEAASEAEGDKVELVEALLLKRGHVHASTNDDDDDDQPILNACRTGNAKVFDLLLAHGADPHVFAADKSTTLMYACGSKYIELVKKLLALHVDPRLKTDVGWTALHSACKAGSLEAAKLLLAHNVDVDIKATAENGATPIYEASCGGNEELFQLLLDRGADPLAPLQNGCDSLHEAGLARNVGIARRIVERKLDLSGGVIANGHTHLHCAASAGCLPIVIMLVEEANVDINALDTRGRSPIFHAASRGHDHVVKYLMENGATHCMEDMYGVTPVLSAVANAHVDVALRLLVANAEGARKRGPQDKSLRTWAERSWSLEMMRFVLRWYPLVQKTLEQGGLPSMPASDESVARQPYTRRCFCYVCTRYLLRGGGNRCCTECDADLFRICNSCRHRGMECSVEGHSLSYHECSECYEGKIV